MNDRKMDKNFLNLTAILNDKYLNEGTFATLKHLVRSYIQVVWMNVGDSINVIL
jgi:hypothetical protein